MVNLICLSKSRNMVCRLCSASRGLETRLLLPFMHVFSVLQCIFKELILLLVSKISSLKMQCYAINTFVNGMCQFGLSLWGLSLSLRKLALVHKITDLITTIDLFLVKISTLFMGDENLERNCRSNKTKFNVNLTNTHLFLTNFTSGKVIVQYTL